MSVPYPKCPLLIAFSHQPALMNSAKRDEKSVDVSSKSERSPGCVKRHRPGLTSGVQ